MILFVSFFERPSKSRLRQLSFQGQPVVIFKFLFYLNKCIYSNFGISHTDKNIYMLFSLVSFSNKKKYQLQKLSEVSEKLVIVPSFTFTQMTIRYLPFSTGPVFFEMFNDICLLFGSSKPPSGLLDPYFRKIKSIFNDFQLFVLFQLFGHQASTNQLLLSNLELPPAIVFFSYLESFDDYDLQRLMLHYPQKSWQFLQTNEKSSQDQNTVLLVEEGLFDKATRVNFLTHVDDKSWSKAILFEYPLIASFFTNKNFEKIINFMFKWRPIFDFIYYLGTKDIRRTFYYLPFFFFWSNFEQPMEDFRLLHSIWYRALLFETELLQPRKTAKKKRTFLWIPDELINQYELKSTWTILKWLSTYRTDQTYRWTYYLRINDLQAFLFDKNFMSVWNYWAPDPTAYEMFWKKEWSGYIGYRWDKLFNPKVFFRSRLQRLPNNYASSYYSRIFEFDFYPDMAQGKGHLNPHFDITTAGHNRFFHFGKTYLDLISALELMWFHVSQNIWGGFSNFVTDYAAFVPTYFPEATASIWLPVILLAGNTTFNGIKDMDLHIAEFNTLFKFREKSFAKFQGQEYFPYDPLDWLAHLWDKSKMWGKVINFEAAMSAFYGHNTSSQLVNHPRWFTSLAHSDNFYKSIPINTWEARNRERRIRELLNHITMHSYTYTSVPSLYFSREPNYSKLFPFRAFTNIKVFDDFGYYLSTLTRVERHQTSKFTPGWLSTYPLFSIEYKPTPRYTWQITILNYNASDWFPAFSYTQFNFYYSKLLTFFYALGWTFDFHTELFLKDWRIALNPMYFYPGPAKQLAIFWNPMCKLTGQKFNFWFCFQMNFTPLTQFIHTEFSNSFVDWILEEIYSFIDFCYDYLPNPFRFYYIPWSKIFESVPKKFYEIYAFLKMDWNLIYASKIPYFIYVLFFFNPRCEELLNAAVPRLLLHIAYPRPNWGLFFNASTPVNLLILFLSTYWREVFLPMFYHDRNFAYIELYNFSSSGYSMAILKQFTWNYSPLPLEFFLPGAIYPTSNILETKIYNFPTAILFPIFPNGKSLSPLDFNGVTDYLLFLTLLELLNREYSTNFLKDFTFFYNWIDWHQIKFKWLEYDWFINYIVRKHCYRGVPR